MVKAKLDLNKRYRYTISEKAKSGKLISALTGKDVDKVIDGILDKIGKDVVMRIRSYIRQYWYKTYTPIDYIRTYDILNTDVITYKKEDGEVRIIYDASALSHAANPGGFGQHYGFKSTVGSFDYGSFGEGLIEFIEHGKFDSGKTGWEGNPRIGDGAEAIDKTINWLNKYVNDEIKKRIKIEIGL